MGVYPVAVPAAQRPQITLQGDFVRSLVGRYGSVELLIVNRFATNEYTANSHSSSPDTNPFDSIQGLTTGLICRSCLRRLFGCVADNTLRPVRRLLWDVDEMTVDSRCGWDNDLCKMQMNTRYGEYE